MKNFRKNFVFIFILFLLSVPDETSTEKEQEKVCEKQPDPTVLLEKNGPITLIGINRPEVRNCINSETASKLAEIIEQFENDEESPIGILHGIGGNFCAGYDLKELSESKDAVGNFMLRSEGAMGPTRRMIRKPLIAAISGYCVAGGLELALMCDLRVMENDAIMGFYNRRFGVPLIDGGTVRLAPLIGLSRALDLVLTGRQVSAKEALEIGLANRIVACGTALGQALNLASSIAKFPVQCMQHDRDSLFNATYNAKNKDEAMDFELMSTSKELLEEAKIGAIKFIEARVGRHGSFADLKEKDIPDWEKEEIMREKDSVIECKPSSSKSKL